MYAVPWNAWDVCPPQFHHLTRAPPANRRPGNAYDPGRRLVLSSIVRSHCRHSYFKKRPQLQTAPSPYLISRPGARDNALIGQCIRCGECVRAWPEPGPSTAINEAGIAGLWTPVLRYRAWATVIFL